MSRFMGHYCKWRETRYNKILEIVGGESFFKGKSILELGCGYGHLGKKFIELGAEVTFADGNEEHLSKIKALNPNSTIFLFDQDKPWDLGYKFDVVLYFGVLYHLRNWQRDLKCALRHGDIIFLESVVCDSDRILELRRSERGYDQSIRGLGTEPSAKYIEKVIEECGRSHKRYDDSGLNAGFHKYDWVVSNTDSKTKNKRRFWRIV